MKKGLLGQHRIVAGIFNAHRYYPRDRDALRTTLIEHLCSYYAREFPNFDREAFIEICGKADPHRPTRIEGVPIPEDAFEVPSHAAYIEEGRD